MTKKEFRAFARKYKVEVWYSGYGGKAFYTLIGKEKLEGILQMEFVYSLPSDMDVSGGEPKEFHNLMITIEVLTKKHKKWKEEDEGLRQITAERYNRKTITW